MDEQALADAACELIGEIFKGLAFGLLGVLVPCAIVAWWVA